MGMHEVVQSDSGEPRPLDQLLVGVGQEVGVGGCAVGSSEDVSLLIGAVEVRVLASATVPPFAQHLDGGRVEVDAAT